MLIIAILAFGFLVGGLAQLMLGRSMRDINWGRAMALGSSDPWWAEPC